MMERILKQEYINEFALHLSREEKSSLTVEKYVRDTRHFYDFLAEGKNVDKERVIAYKEYLKDRYRVSSANSMLAALNAFLDFRGWGDCRVKQFKIQRVLFCGQEKQLTKKEYERLLNTSLSKGSMQLNLIMQAICSTGIRVSELQYITVKAVNSGYAYINNKGKARLIFLPQPLMELLKEFCSRQGITRGPVFVDRKGVAVSRYCIWKKMKGLCKDAGVAPEKVFPHNLRHLFAFTFYRLEKDLLRLAEVLGHSSIETTRIYTATNGKEHRKIISRLGLVYG